MPKGSDSARTGKSPSAFRTISEVAAELDLQQHVLRFWETKFPQIKPLKRGGGRRYYRPEDVALLGRIKSLLHEQGYTIKGVQKLLRQGGPMPEAEEAAPAATPAAVEQVLDGRRRAELSAILGELEAMRDELRRVAD